MTRIHRPSPTLARQPIHPGAMLREDVLPALRLSVARAAKHLMISRQSLHRILAEEAAVTPDMALRLGKLCGNGPELWLAMQQAHDLWGAAQDLAATIVEIPTLQAA